MTATSPAMTMIFTLPAPRGKCSSRPIPIDAEHVRTHRPGAARAPKPDADIVRVSCRRSRRSSPSSSSSLPATGSRGACTPRRRCARSTTRRAQQPPVALATVPRERRLDDRFATAPSPRPANTSPTKQMLIDNRVMAGRAGYHVVTPLALEDGRVRPRRSRLDRPAGIAIGPAAGAAARGRGDRQRTDLAFPAPDISSSRPMPRAGR